jgi:hypothetical protein
MFWSSLPERYEYMTEEEFTTSMKSDIEAFFRQKYGPLSFQYNYVTPKEHNTAKIDFTINGSNDFMRRYAGAVSYVDGQLSFQNVVRLW